MLLLLRFWQSIKIHVILNYNRRHTSMAEVKHKPVKGPRDVKPIQGGRTKNFVTEKYLRSTIKNSTFSNQIFDSGENYLLRRRNIVDIVTKIELLWMAFSAFRCPQKPTALCCNCFCRAINISLTDFYGPMKQKCEILLVNWTKNHKALPKRYKILADFKSAWTVASKTTKDCHWKCHKFDH